MKKVIVFLLLISSLALADGWNSVITTSLNVLGAQDVKMFSNGFGNNLVVLSSGVLSYYLMESDGSLSNPTTIESGVTYPCITGNDNIVYIVYKKNNVVKFSYTTME